MHRVCRNRLCTGFAPVHPPAKPGPKRHQVKVGAVMHHSSIYKGFDILIAAASRDQFSVSIATHQGAGCADSGDAAAGTRKTLGRFASLSAAFDGARQARLAIDMLDMHPARGCDAPQAPQALQPQTPASPETHDGPAASCAPPAPAATRGKPVATSARINRFPGTV
jgi:hypothetical protein